jgi:hypothetical protein
MKKFSNINYMINNNNISLDNKILEINKIYDNSVNQILETSSGYNMYFKDIKGLNESHNKIENQIREINDRRFAISNKFDKIRNVIMSKRFHEQRKLFKEKSHNKNIDSYNMNNNKKKSNDEYVHPNNAITKLSDERSKILKYIHQYNSFIKYNKEKSHKSVGANYEDFIYKWRGQQYKILKNLGSSIYLKNPIKIYNEIKLANKNILKKQQKIIKKANEKVKQHKDENKKITKKVNKIKEKVTPRFTLNKHAIDATLTEYVDRKLIYNSSRDKRFNDSLANDNYDVIYKYANLDPILLTLDDSRPYTKSQVQTYDDYFQEIKGELKKFLVKTFENKNSFVYYITINPSYSKYVMDKNVRFYTYNHDTYHRIKLQRITNLNAINVDDIIDKLIDQIQNFQESGSNWLFNCMNQLFVHIGEYRPFRGGTYIDLPDEIKNTKACINIKNDDEKCLKWCLIAHLNPIASNQNPSKFRHYKNKEHLIKDDGINYPIKKEDIPKFEKLNNIKINVYAYINKKEGIIPYYINKNTDDKIINLLLITDGEKYHFVLIKNFSRLIYSFNNHKCKKHVCFKCLHPFSSEDILKRHIVDCNPENPSKIEMPIEGKNDIVKFKNYKHKMRVPFVIYFDFEALTTKIEGVNPNPNLGSYTNKYQNHIACGASYKVVSIDPSYNKEFIFRGENANDELLKSLLETQNEILEIINNVEPMKMTNEQIKEFENSKLCHICNKVFTLKEVRGEGYKLDKVRDHCHITGEYRGPAHNSCNLNFKNKPFIPVVAHNLRGYDAHLILQIAGKYTKNISTIPLNHEKYVSFNIEKLKFIDSYSFMNTSLESLANNLKDEDFKLISKLYKDEQFELIRQKGVYPYDYMDSFDRFNESQLPPIEMFTSLLTNNKLSKEDYKHAQKVWKKFNIKNLGEYHDLYLKSDVYMLADIFEKFRDVSMQCYGLDPFHYLTLPGFAWDCMLNMTNIELELLTDIDMYNFIEKSIRGGVSYINHRHAVANNKYMSTYDDSKPTSFITYLDANNLYGWAMSQSLPNGNFKWENPNNFNVDIIKSLSDEKDTKILIENAKYTKEQYDSNENQDKLKYIFDNFGYGYDKNNNFEWLEVRHYKNKLEYEQKRSEIIEQLGSVSSDFNYLSMKRYEFEQYINENNVIFLEDLKDKYETFNKDIGYIFEVDLTYPQELHDLHNDYPLAVEKKIVTKDQLSPYCVDVMNKNNIKMTKIEKLIPSLENKTKYVVHYRNLKKYIELGLIVTKIHRVLSFSQSAWLKQYIDFNSKKRAESKTSFEKDFYKLMNNAVYGKTIEDVKKRINFEMATSMKKRDRLINSVYLKSFKIFNENLAGFELVKKSVKLIKPFYVGFCVLELSKLLMYNFHYDYIKNKYGDRSRLLFTDTDSLTYHIQAKDINEDLDVFQDFYNDRQLFDLSDVYGDFNDKTNKKIIGKFKDETNFIPIKEFTGLRSKLYSILLDFLKVNEFNSKQTNDKDKMKCEKKTAKGISTAVKKNVIKHNDYKYVLDNKTQQYNTMRTIKSELHNIYSIEVNKISLSCFDDKRYILNDGISSLSYGHYKI